MRHTELPPKQGLYDPQFEKDACGMGFVAHIKGKPSHEIVSNALTMLANMEHRGGQGSEPNSGDGAGIMLQIPHRFFSEEAKALGFELPEAGRYGVGMLFLSHNEDIRAAHERALNEIIAEEGQTLLGYRDVPTCDEMLGKTAKAAKPYVRQVFIGRSADIKDDLAFERKLYVIRKRAELAIRYAGSEEADSFYLPSLSCRKIVYKGMLTTEQVGPFYLDLQNEALESAIALVHSRFSTNTFPSWERAHPYRFMIHNGEINTLRGNVNWMHARQSLFKSEVFGSDLDKIKPVINPDGSDTAMFDNTFEFLYLSGRSLPHVAMMMVPEPWSNHDSMDEKKKAFYEYHSTLMEPWDGPAAMGFTDGVQIGAILDRNGLRPSRYYVTKDDLIILSSEAGVLDIPPENVLYKDRLRPGRMLLVDTQEGRIISDEEVKAAIASEHPYQEWLDEHLISLSELPEAPELPNPKHDNVQQLQQAFGYTFEDLRKVLEPMASSGAEAVGSMGYDAPLAVLSDRPQRLYNYFKQMFAQVTNPPIDAIREELVTSTTTTIGPERNLLKPEPESCRQIALDTPILSNEDFAKIRHVRRAGFKSMTIPTLFPAGLGAEGLRIALDRLNEAADRVIEKGHNILILSDRGVDRENAAIPALLAVSSLHHHLIRQGTRTKVTILLESGEPREVHHYALLLGYGVSAVNPYLAFESLDDMISQGLLRGVSHEKAVKNYIKAATKSVIKILSKMGISTIQSYRGAQIFEAVGLKSEFVDRYFTWTPSRIGGIGLEEVTMETLAHHSRAFSDKDGKDKVLDSGGEYQWRSDGEDHLFNPQTIHLLQHSVRSGDYEMYKKYSALVQGESKKHQTLRSLIEFKQVGNPVPLEEVEPVESIMKRFKTGAMSFGSISKEAHETLAIAMNRIGGKSNTGEGGEDPARFTPDANGDSRRSAIKQVASGRFGVTSNYLVNADEIQIKMAQGAKPGEGGQLPGRKVYPWVAEVRGSTAGVGLISPPPHHDIYSIEDLAELIYDLKNANPRANINVKLVSEVGVGTIAAGVAKGRADVILISGYDGGTGASPMNSIRHAGLPWELGLAETHQTLMLNNLRDRVVLEADGKMLSGRDLAVAALLGAEEFGFATAPLVAVGCIMMRVCQMDTCPVGVATQNPDLRKNFAGDPQHVVNFMTFVAQDLREIMASLGFRTIEEMVGRTDCLDAVQASYHWKKKGVDLSGLLHTPELPEGSTRFNSKKQNHGLEETLDVSKLLPLAAATIENGTATEASLPITNVNRAVGTILGSEVTRKYGAAGLPEDTIRLHFTGSAGQSLGAFVPKGITITVEGDTNDYIGKGLSGGKLIVKPSPKATFAAEENIIVGNTGFYGATSGEAYISGIAGERFAVRNSGAKVVVEGVGDHGCEYMTGGRVVVLGGTGRNFAAGMSGGIAYVFDPDNTFINRCNLEMVLLERVEEAEEIEDLRGMITRHTELTGSSLGQRVLDGWADNLPKFVRVIPKDYKRMMDQIRKVEESGLTGEAAMMAAFEANMRELARVGG
ncbi:glutamate synthase domain-containing protein 2/glutamate synthase domain-containing protein 1/glutamate synthase domain-containing protein 3 [Paenibacillus forsythiae]|uniref:Glutamate synthase domain-containing protein 2/glutamate synthase domain-containing protein 1/glutamate synthase domain-containing protein 3 n=1 Tax=Paenibacillus forsythiae TaxID=365616 RepID=A0ABU3H8M0_9BACL|nr:glutamate synthase large subunit [Paenibacillus forsythiae]MDT3427169.1 glutamate synthase domain-containing protein 2/glutamate synthase domain-containing protein 1/glutamate synthase domain-containing protein 3 [Paenibacillus forsythiae]